ncbi:hypothetical protein KUTeg_012387 [Tegillarca granosa]|uniref:Uncharacterized protein n=1 Tax=Tegillarca granosa TaxID=220873 RepID=A0ABQ9EZC5_TEGGR|nr:hypothetical protein KUTeg_012387 [Tegillarca granosa]
MFNCSVYNQLLFNTPLYLSRANENRWDKAGKPPDSIIPTKGSVHITANRAFIDFILHNETAKRFLNWTKETSVPDETFFSSINHNPHLNVPGSYQGEPETDPFIKPFLTRFKNWGTWPFDWKCYGKRVRMICVFGVEDVPLLVTSPEFFANKFYSDFEPLALDCMEEIHFYRTREQYENNLSFNSTYYENLPFIKKYCKLSAMPKRHKVSVNR